MGFIFGLIKNIFKLTLYFAIFVSIILLIPNLPPYKKFTIIEYETTLARTGALAPNYILNNPEKLYEGKLSGPEAFELYNGEVYTGLATGEIVKLSPGGHVTFVAKLGKPCSGTHEEHLCGRPLGLEIDSKTGQLYVADAYRGIWKINLKTNDKKLLVAPKVEINGRKPMFFNNIAVHDNGDVYWTDSSSDYGLKDGAYAALMDPSGRLFLYDVAKNINTVLLDNLAFPNDVIISLDKQYLLLTETGAFRILKYYIDGPKKGTSEVFVAGLPGLPDTIRVLPDGSGILVALYNVFDEENPLLTKTLGPLPTIRKFLMRIVLMIENSFEFLNSQFPHPVFESAIYHLGSFESVSSFLPELKGLVQIDWNGNIIAAYYNTDNKIAHISDAIVFNDKLYTGSPQHQNFIAAFPVPDLLKKAFTISKSSSGTETKKEFQKEYVNVKREEIKQVNTNAKLPEVSPQEAKKTDKDTKTQQTQKVPEAKYIAKDQVKPTGTTQKPDKNISKEQIKPVENAQQVNKNIPKEQKKPEANARQPENKQVVSNFKEKSESKEAPKQNVKAKVDQDTLKSKPNVKTEDNVKPKEIPKVSDTKQKTVPDKTQNTIEAEKKKPQQEKSNSDASGSKTTTIPPNTRREASSPENTKTTTPKPVKKEIPVVENIPSDTAKPTKENLKVIKKSGPQVITNPIL